MVGDVIGKYHPHGDAAVYEALVRLAQDFAARYPLVEGQGNFGNIDGDNAAAMRYTEARLTEVAGALLAGIDEDAVDFRPTYDGEEQRAGGAAGARSRTCWPTAPPASRSAWRPPSRRTMPARSAMPPLHLIARARGDHRRRCWRCMPGPDFPTGGVLVEDAATIAAAYETGRGGFRLRARWEVEDAASTAPGRSSSPKSPTRCRKPA